MDDPILHRGDCVAWLESLEESSVDVIVTDPPYGLSPDGRARTWDDLEELHRKRGGFMGRAWDAGVPGVRWARAVHRALKPGGFAVAFSHARTVHRLAGAMEDAGLEIRDQIGWVYFNGFPKSLDLARAADQRRDDREEILELCAWIREARDAAGLTNQEIDARFDLDGMTAHWCSSGKQPIVPTRTQWGILTGEDMLGPPPEAIRALFDRLDSRKGTWGEERPDRITAEREDSIVLGSGTREVIARGSPVSDLAQRWEGWGTALKPAIEPAVLARKPMDGTYVDNLRKWGVGGLNIDPCRYAPGDPAWIGPDSGSGAFVAKHASTEGLRMGDGYGGFGAARRTGEAPDGRFPSNLYACKKPSTEERERGTDGLPSRSGADLVGREEGSAGTLNPRAGAGRVSAARRNIHPTVKPVRLFRWLCRLLCPPGGLIVDPFLGSGTTGIAATLEGFRFAGCDLDDDGEYIPIARARIEHARRFPEAWADTAPPRPTRDPGDRWGYPATQIGLFGGEK